MKRTIISAVFACSAFAIPSQALAESPYSSEDIVKHFIQSADMGAARGICIGTADECNQDVQKPSGFDMLINFELDSAELTPQARENLNEFARALKDDRLRAAKFMVEGHTDASGSERYNEGLSERRAQSVTAFLLDQGVSPEKVDAIGMGESSPRSDDPFNPVNRRVEMHISVQ